MANRPVTSREYKLMLNTDRFQDRGRGTEVFFDLLSFLIDKEGGAVTEPQDEEKKRLTSYLDTPERALRQAGFALRLRDERQSGGKLELNLKYRAGDRYLSAAQDLDSPLPDKPKFEEDVLPPFTSKFSNSNTLKSDAPFDADTVGKVVALFPGLGSLNLDAGDAVKTVNDFTAAEVVRELCKFKFGGEREIEAGLSFWYRKPDETGWPLVAEFSFAYKAAGGGEADKLEQFPAATVEGANRLFAALQGQVGWLDLNGTTKTAFALDVL